MLDDYSLRLLAEIGVDVYVPRDPSSRAPEDAKASNSGAENTAHADKAQGRQRGAEPKADVLILCEDRSQQRLLADLLRSLRACRLDAMLGEPGNTDSVAAASSLIVLGESLARSMGADMPAQRQNEISWIVSHEPAALARNADAKRALWGEIKRLSRSQIRHSNGA